MPVDTTKLKAKNGRDKFYLFFINLLNELEASKTKKEFLLNRGKIDILISRLSDKHLKSDGIVDYGNTILLINLCYLKSKMLGIYKLNKLIFNDLISFAQSLRMFSGMSSPKPIDMFKVIMPLHDDLYLVCYAYFKARQSDVKWKNIAMKLISIDNEEDFMKQDNLKVSAFEIGKYIFDNDSTNPYFKLTTKEASTYIMWLLKKGHATGFPTKKFHSAVMSLVGKYAAKFFDFEEQKVFHITGIENAIKIIDSGETLIKNRRFLNDSNEQKAFAKILKHQELLSGDSNYSYRSFSLTTSSVPNETIFRYAKSYKDAVIFEFDKFNSQNLIYTWDTHEFDGRIAFVDTGSLIGKVVYDSEVMEKYWEEALMFIAKIKDAFDKSQAFIRKEWDNRGNEIYSSPKIKSGR